MVSVSSHSEERGLAINMLVVGTKIKRFIWHADTRVRRWVGWGVGGQGDTGKKVGPFQHDR